MFRIQYSVVSSQIVDCLAIDPHRGAGMTRQLLNLAAILILLAIVGSAVWSFFPRDQFSANVDFIIGVTAFAIGVVTFFGIAGLNRSPQDPPLLTDERLRTAIACGLLMSYLYMVTFTTFVANALKVGEVTKAFVESFSSVMGITIAFYFGASAATQIFAKDKSASDKTTEQK